MPPGCAREPVDGNQSGDLPFSVEALRTTETESSLTNEHTGRDYSELTNHGPGIALSVKAASPAGTVNEKRATGGTLVRYRAETESVHGRPRKSISNEGE
ncbi:hypothetical protein GCM10009753_02280 [Streptantibioticus ferralitis]